MKRSRVGNAINVRLVALGLMKAIKFWLDTINSYEHEFCVANGIGGAITAFLFG